MTPNVELIYDEECPNVEPARRHLRKAFGELGLPPRWQEWERRAPDAPHRVSGYGSPTILVNGNDVAGDVAGSAADSCRLYRDSSGAIQGAPSVEAIVSSLRHTTGSPGGYRSVLAMFPAVGVALLPKVACPACWPAYSGVLAALGLGFLAQTQYLLPLTLVFLIAAVGSLALRARMRRGYGPFGVGVLAGIIVMVAKFVFDSDAAMYGGIGLLVAASVWNSWPMRSRAKACPACVNADEKTTLTTT